MTDQVSKTGDTSFRCLPLLLSQCEAVLDFNNEDVERHFLHELTCMLGLRLRALSQLFLNI